MKRLDEHGQMILIAGFIIGIGIVVLSVMLNNIIYASNTASESSIETNVFDYSNVVDTNIEAYEKAYANSGGGYDNTTFDAYMANYSERMVKSYALSGFIFTLYTGSMQDAYFTENGLADGNDDWTVIERVNKTDIFTLDKLNASLLGNESNKFVIEINNSLGNTIWSASMFNSNGNIAINISNQSTIIGNYSSSSGFINITSNQIDGVDVLPALSFPDVETYSIRFINGSQAIGTFLLEGNLVNDDPFYIERVNVVNSTMKLNKNNQLEINVTIPITLPRGHV